MFEGSVSVADHFSLYYMDPDQSPTMMQLLALTSFWIRIRDAIFDPPVRSKIPLSTNILFPYTKSILRLYFEIRYQKYKKNGLFFMVEYKGFNFTWAKS